VTGRRTIATLLALACFAGACVSLGESPLEAQMHARVPTHRLAGDTTWSGDVTVDGVVYVPEGVTLTIAPGTRVRMAWADRDGNEIGDAGLYVRGAVHAVGTAEAPIVFEPGALDDDRPSRWGEVKMEYAHGNRFEHVRFRRAHWALHAHFSDVTVRDCFLEEGDGGIRFRAGDIVLERNAFARNHIGIRFWYSRPTIVANRFEANGTGIFFREGVRPFPFTANSFDSRRYHVALGEGQRRPIAAAGNWWGTTDTAGIEAKVYDHADDARLGAVHVEPILTAPGAAGPEAG